MFTVGDTGSGKSFSSKQNFIRSIEQSKDRIGIILEPLNNWAGVSEALDAKRITVGGTLGLNPLEIRETPEHVQRAMGEDASPFNEKLDDAMSFLTNFFALRGISLGDRRTTLELALKRAYKRQGITDDISTHSNPSPTIRDMMDVFEDMVDDPEEFVVRSDEEAGKIKEDATWLLDQLRPFEDDGRHANLGQESDFDIRDEKVIYLDLAQQEGSVDSSTALTMQLLISLVYERAKVSEKEVVFYIDEARYIMQDAASLAFLETVFRHHRHHDLSIRLVTQTVDEFFEHAESEAILDQCAVKQFHRLDGMDKAWADEFGLNYAQMRFVQDAVPGNEDAGFSEALVGVDGEWRGSRSKRCPRRNRSSTSSQPSNGEPHSPALARIRWTRTYRRSRRTLKAERQTTDNSHLSGRQQRLMVVQQEVATMREYLRVTLTSERLNPERLPQALESLHKLTSTDSTGLADKLNPLHSKTPLRFEFLALSEGADDPVEFYYGADDHLDTLEKRLRSIYPETFDIERTEVDVASRLVQPVEFDRETFVDHYESGDLTYEFGPDEQYERGTDDDSQARPADAESVADGGTVGDLSTDHIIEFGDTALELAPPDAIPEDQPLTTLAKPTVTSDGTILARPATETVSPLGVRWQGRLLGNRTG